MARDLIRQIDCPILIAMNLPIKYLTLCKTHLLKSGILICALTLLVDVETFGQSGRHGFDQWNQGRDHSERPRVKSELPSGTGEATTIPPTVGRLKENEGQTFYRSETDLKPQDPFNPWPNQSNTIAPFPFPPRGNGSKSNRSSKSPRHSDSNRDQQPRRSAYESPQYPPGFQFPDTTRGTQEVAPATINGPRNFPSQKTMTRYWDPKPGNRTAPSRSENPNHQQLPRDIQSPSRPGPWKSRNGGSSSPVDPANDYGNLETEQERHQRLINDLIVDPEAGNRQPHRRQQHAGSSSESDFQGYSESSEVSPGHWGALEEEPNTGWSPQLQDPPLYDPKKDPNPPKKSFREVWYNGRKFSSFDILYVEPRYRNNATFLIQDTGQTSTQSSDFKLDVATRLGFGFESKSGPGVEMYYTELDQTARFSATSTATASVTTQVFGSPISQTASLATFAPNQTIDVTQSSDLQYFDVTFFKFLKFPIAALVGHIGIRYAEIDHEHHASLFDSGGTAIGGLRNESDFLGFGPKLGITYIRPIGHTRFRLVGAMAGTLLAGDREQRIIDNQGTMLIHDPNEQLITTMDLRLGVEWASNVTDSTSFYARCSYESQHWFNGGSPIDPNSSFGFSGLVFGIGLNR